jgi:hypothetical protein
MRLSEVLWCTLLDKWCINIILMHALSYPSRSTMCKDRLPWVPLQLQVSQVDRAYPLSVHIISYISRTCQGSRIPYIPYLDGFFENKLYIRRAHRAAEDTWACHCSKRQPLQRLGCPKQHRIRMVVGPHGLSLRPWSKVSTVDQGSCDGCLWKDGRSVYYDYERTSTPAGILPSGNSFQMALLEPNRDSIGFQPCSLISRTWLIALTWDTTSQKAIAVTSIREIG